MKTPKLKTVELDKNMLEQLLLSLKIDEEGMFYHFETSDILLNDPEKLGTLCIKITRSNFDNPEILKTRIYEFTKDGISLMLGDYNNWCIIKSCIEITNMANKLTNVPFYPIPDKSVYRSGDLIINIPKFT